MIINNKNRLNSKGLDKIFGESINDVIKEIENSDNLKYKSSEIEISKILSNPHQPRKIFNDNELKELSISIKKYGIIQPIIVKRDVNGYCLISGERRTRASKLAGLSRIPAIILDSDNRNMREIALIENIQRVDLNPIEEAIAYKELIELLNITQEELANRIGKSRSYVANILRLLNLPDEIQDYVLTKKLTMGQVKPLISLQYYDIDNVKEIAQRIINEKLNVREVERIVKLYMMNFNKNKTYSDKFKINDSNGDPRKRAVNEFLESKIMARLGTKVLISKNKIIINYLNVKDLNRILEILGLL